MITPPDYGEPWEATNLHFLTTKGNFSTGMLASLHSKRIARCVNACQGMADPAAEIQAMRDAIKDADSALRKCLNHLLMQPTFARNSSDIERESETMESVHVVLGKLQPFIK